MYKKVLFFIRNAGLSCFISFLWSVFMIKQLFVALFSDFVRNRMLCIYYNKGKL
ncbi:hypothetical protein M076_3578 [Bacteroides fragilis str. 2-F-2 |uniref:Transmembrane protein n=1 Tax=Bacteroides fragilis str. 2-F-2 \|nr:hypothetical protein M077_3750 [Bacteroides fragilis str. 2-F-2 \